MYYVIIKKSDTHPMGFIGLKVPKFITKKDSDNVIFEFKIDGKVVRKWVDKKNILLLTDDKAFYLKTMQSFKNIEEEQQQLVETAQNKLNETIENYAQKMDEEFKNFEEIRGDKDIPCILKDL
jgi:glucosamine 6-phosphate synthetase-like amidotransferase/phosphosugar isomerase protein